MLAASLPLPPGSVTTVRAHSINFSRVTAVRSADQWVDVCKHGLTLSVVAPEPNHGQDDAQPEVLDIDYSELRVGRAVAFHGDGYHAMDARGPHPHTHHRHHCAGLQMPPG